MSKIEIHNIQELIEQKYPVEIIEKFLNDILILGIQVKDDYPNYKDWYKNVQLPGIYDETRNIIIAHIKDKIVGFVSLKKTLEEKKICTFYEGKNFRRHKIGTILATKAVDYLEEEKTLITIPMNKLHEFTRIAEKYNWEVTEIKENLYRTTTPEVIVNGTVSEKNDILIPSKNIEKVYKIYKISRYKRIIQFLLNNPQKLWK